MSCMELIKKRMRKRLIKKVNDGSLYFTMTICKPEPLFSLFNVMKDSEDDIFIMESLERAIEIGPTIWDYLMDKVNDENILVSSYNGKCYYLTDSQRKLYDAKVNDLWNTYKKVYPDFMRTDFLRASKTIRNIKVVIFDILIYALLVLFFKYTSISSLDMMVGLILGLVLVIVISWLALKESNHILLIDIEHKISEVMESWEK